MDTYQTSSCTRGRVRGYPVGTQLKVPAQLEQGDLHGASWYEEEKKSQLIDLAFWKSFYTGIHTFFLLLINKSSLDNSIHFGQFCSLCKRDQTHFFLCTSMYMLVQHLHNVNRHLGRNRIKKKKKKKDKVNFKTSENNNERAGAVNMLQQEHANSRTDRKTPEKLPVCGHPEVQLFNWQQFYLAGSRRRWPTSFWHGSLLCE